MIGRRQIIQIGIKNWKAYYDFIDEVRDEVDYVEGLKLAFTEWVQALSLEDVRRQYDIFGEDSLFITFNYTLTLENVYHIPAYRILHIMVWWKESSLNWWLDTICQIQK